MKSYCKFEVKVLRTEKFVNELSHDFLIKDIERKEGNILSFKTEPGCERKLKKYLKKKDIEILLVDKKGAYYGFLNIIKSWGLIAGIVLGLVFFFVQTMFIKQVEVWSDGQVSEQEVVKLVKPYTINKLKSSIDTKDLEVKIYDEFEDLSFVSVAVVGQTVVVNVKKEVKPSEMEDEFTAIKAKEDGRITSIELVQGTLCVKVGDIVRRGDDLVLPYVINAQGEEQKIIPKARIMADVWITSEVMHNSYSKENFRTGNKVTKNEVLLCGIKIYDNGKVNPFENYDTVIKDKHIAENNILPFILRETTYYEIEERIVQQGFSEVKEKIIEQCKQNNLQKMGDCEIIKKENTIIKEAGNITTVIHTSVVSRDIGG